MRASRATLAEIWGFAYTVRYSDQSSSIAHELRIICNSLFFLGVSAQVAYVNPPYACDVATVTNKAELVGKIALVDRGACYFLKKAQTAQAVGAIAVIVGMFRKRTYPALLCALWYVLFYFVRALRGLYIKLVWNINFKKAHSLPEMLCLWAQSAPQNAHRAIADYAASWDTARSIPNKLALI